MAPGESSYPVIRIVKKNAPISRQGFSTSWATALGYLVTIAIAELLTTQIEPRIGVILHGLLLILLFLHASLWAKGPFRRFLVCLALVPLTRLVSLAIPLPEIPLIYWYPVVGLPLFLASAASIRVGKVNRGMLGLKRHIVPLQLLIAITGIGLGFIEFIILQPTPLISRLVLGQVLAPALILLIFTGFLEELIFRGLLQYSAMRSFGMSGFWYVALVFAILHLGYHSLLNLLFVFIVAIYFGWTAWRTGSILGVSLAHGLTNISLFIVFPLLIAAPAHGPTEPAIEAEPLHPLPGLIAPVAPQSVPPAWFPPTPTPFLPLSQTETPTPEIMLTPTACLTPDGWTAYIVREGDSLFGLSKLLRVDVVVLRQANCLSTNKIIPGQRLYLPLLPSTAAPPTQYPTNEPTRTEELPLPELTETPTSTPLLPSSTPEGMMATATASPLPPIEPLPSQTPFPTVAKITPTQAPLPTDRINTPTPTFPPTPTFAPPLDTSVPTYTPLPPTETQVPTETPIPATDTPSPFTETPSVTLQPTENPTEVQPTLQDTLQAYTPTPTSSPHPTKTERALR